MTRGQSKKGKNKNKTRDLSQTPKQDLVEDGRDVEFAQEFADEADRKAQERSQAADQRAKQHKK